jgi:hypothetical protein
MQSRQIGTEEGALPSFRTQATRPFQNTGIDHFGPLILRDGSKVWCLLFTCAVTRAIHLEVVTSLDAKETSLAIRRFIARRGKADFFISDNGRAFLCMAKLLKGVVSWEHIPAAAPWWGGFWERMVGTVKRSCKKTLGNSSLSLQELQTVLTELEDRINRRPLTPSDDVGITPAHFLFIGPPPPLETVRLSDKVPPVPESTPQVLTRKYHHLQQTSCHLWRRWKSDYLLTLRNWHRPQLKRPVKVNVGDIVLVSPPDGVKIHRNLWPMARIEKLLQGADGNVRAVTLRLHGKLTT